MRWVLWALAVMALVGSAAMADSADLSNGVLITHAPAVVEFSDGAEWWCQQYADNWAITSCEEQVARIDCAAMEQSAWFIIAAWAEEKEFCGFNLGFGAFDPYLFSFSEDGTCAPAGILEIPTAGWPGPGEGIAVVAAGEPYTPWTGSFVPIQFFVGYCYYGTEVMQGQIPIDVDPASGQMVIGTCATPPVSYEPVAGAMGFGVDGIEVCFDTELTGACCTQIGDECQVLTAAECTNAGGEYQGDDTICDPNPCPELWACCVEYEVCVMMTEDDCLAASGDWRGIGAICIANGGDVSCTTPVAPTSWGKIKAIYR